MIGGRVKDYNLDRVDQRFPWFVLWASHNFSLKLEFQHVMGRKGFHRIWIKLEYLNPLTVIIHLITCEGKFSVCKSFISIC